MVFGKQVVLDTTLILELLPVRVCRVTHLSTGYNLEHEGVVLQPPQLYQTSTVDPHQDVCRVSKLYLFTQRKLFHVNRND